LLPDLKWRVEVAPIGKMSIRLRQHRMYWLRPPLAGEGFMLGCMQRLLREGDVVYDIGANIGLYSRFLAQYFKASRVYAFEPVESNRTLLAENLKIGGCSARVTIVPFAVGNEDGTSDFQVDDLTSNSGTLDAVTQGSPSQSHAQYGLPAATIPVTVVRLDTIVHAEGFAKPDLIKLDVEGAEAMALEGARAMLSDLRPHLIIELHGVRPARDVLQILWSIGYHCFGYLNLNGTSVYRELLPDMLKDITDMYSVHFLVATRNAEDMLRPVASFSS